MATLEQRPWLSSLVHRAELATSWHASLRSMDMTSSSVPRTSGSRLPHEFSKAMARGVHAVKVDLRTFEGVETFYEEILSRGRPVSAIAINAGVGVGGDFARETDLRDELAMIQLNVVSTVHLAKLVARDMVRTRRRAHPHHVIGRRHHAHAAFRRVRRNKSLRPVVCRVAPSRADG